MLIMIICAFTLSPSAVERSSSFETDVQILGGNSCVSRSSPGVVALPREPLHRWLDTNCSYFNWFVWLWTWELNLVLNRAAHPALLWMKGGDCVRASCTQHCPAWPAASEIPCWRTCQSRSHQFSARFVTVIIFFLWSVGQKRKGNGHHETNPKGQRKTQGP